MEASDRSEAGERADVGQLASRISREIVRLHVRLYGRGPTRAKTFVEDEYVLTVLEEIFTAAEKTLIAAEKGTHVIDTRGAFQEAVRDDFVAIVEETLERKVKSFMSQVDLSRDLAAELFLLEDSGSAAPPVGNAP